MTSKNRGRDWTDEEVSVCVAAYFEHLAISNAGGKFVKEQLYRNLAQTTGGSAASISLKFQNISAVLDELGREWMKGLKPRRNYQELLASKIEEHLDSLGTAQLLERATQTEESFNEALSFHLEAAPDFKKTIPRLPQYLERLVHKVDHVARDSRNRSIGTAGEEFVFNYEKQQLLLAGKLELAKAVRWVASEDGDGAGYDILSFTERGEKKFIEVKTTVGNRLTPFFVSRNEYQFCKQAGDNFRLVRLYDFRRNKRGFELTGSLENQVSLTTETYRAQFHG